MTNIVPAEDIERIVGRERHGILHYARAVSREQQVYILHSRACLDTYLDLRDCPWSLALDSGIHVDQWTEDVPLAVGVVDERLVPLAPEQAAAGGAS